MKTKNITLSILLTTLIISASCSGMDYMSNTYNSTTNMIKTHMMIAQHLTSNFLNRCWKVSILGTIYASFGFYDFKKITGLDENKLDTYSSEQIKKGLDRIENMALYGGSEEKLKGFANLLDTHYLKAQNREKYPSLSAEQEKAVQEIKTIINEK